MRSGSLLGTPGLVALSVTLLLAISMRALGATDEPESFPPIVQVADTPSDVATANEVSIGGQWSYTPPLDWWFVIDCGTASDRRLRVARARQDTPEANFILPLAYGEPESWR